jgi:hypothetical protein
MEIAALGFSSERERRIAVRNDSKLCGNLMWQRCQLEGGCPGAGDPHICNRYHAIHAYTCANILLA